MNEKGATMKQTLSIVLLVALVLISMSMVRTIAQEEVSSKSPAEKWEYLAVAGPSTANLTATGYPQMRKEPSAPFGREAFVLEQHLDKLGANGWELIAVAGPPTDPAYYFKRRRR